MIRTTFACLALLVLSNAAGIARADAAPPAGVALRRFALFVGSNAGGGGRKELRYALSDATALSRVLAELGGLSEEDTRLLENPSPAELERALVTQGDRVAGAARRTEFIFYYSGHSDDEGLRLGEALVPYPTLRAWIERVRASVRIVVLDSCASGSFTRAKGGVHVSPFLFDASIDVQGQAVLTASSESETAQESDRLGGSFFTHYLVAGLRGAADTGGDGRVTLTEAYRYAFDETLARTGRTQGGVQHPSYDIRLSGTGDLVITDLHGGGARVVFAPELEGRLYVRDASAKLLVELQKRSGHKTALSLPSGAYTVLLERPHDRAEARLSLRSHEELSVSNAMFTRVSLEPTRTRGVDDDLETTLVPVGLSLVTPYDNYGGPRSPKRSYLALHALYGEPAELTGMAFALGGNGSTRSAAGLLLAAVFNRYRMLRGVSLAGVANASSERTRGLSIATLFNLMRGEHRGVTASFGFNSVRQAQGLELSAINVTQELTGVAVGGLHVARSVRGAQVGAMSWASQLRGAQAGGLNIARDVHGLQLGFVNVAAGDVAGAQIGLFNYARSADAGIAPVSVTREGGVHAQLVSGTLAVTQAAVRFDARYTYSFFGAGWHPLGGSDEQSYLFGGGFGGKIPIVSVLYAEVDAALYGVQPLTRWVQGLPCSAAELRLVLRVEIYKHLSVLAGITFDTLINRSPKDGLYPGFTRRLHRGGNEDTEVAYGPGFVSGLRF